MKKSSVFLLSMVCLLSKALSANPAISKQLTQGVGFSGERLSSPSSLSNEENPDAQIGNSYFRGGPQKTISQWGAAIEDRLQQANVYLFLNQYFKTRWFYEIRAYGIYHYLTHLPPAPPLVPQVIPVSSEKHPLGTGGSAIVGYNFEINTSVSFMPFIRAQCLTNSGVAYADSFGNRIHSVNYSSSVGGKLSMRVTDRFAVYVQPFLGYAKSILNGQGVFSTSRSPLINAFLTTIEFGSPYKLTARLSITPYIQLITTSPHPNQIALKAPYQVNPLTTTENAFAIKFGYEF